MSEHISDVVLHEAHRSRYLNYALSVITSRALPDVRDGMKPVQRRILYAMFRNLRLTPEAKHRKSAAVVGEVMAKYHPHGDQSIYDAMVRMAQDFSLRYALVDGQGNFGSLDGDRAAAMRYTEARLRHVAIEFLSELGKQTVDYRQNYDGTQTEPTVLPAQVPGLLINGATGIAVGMATNVPPHNLREVVRALIALIDQPDLPEEKLIGKYIKGPDFPTGGCILNSREELLKIYSSGRGPLEVRGEYELEKEGRTTQIIINSIPYTVNKANLISEIAEHIRRNRIPQILDVRDESTEQIRIVLELKRGANPDAAMAFLYKKTSLQSRFDVNLTALCPTEDPYICQPKQLNLRAMLVYFLDFRMEVTRRRLRFDLDQLERRIHILEAFEIIFSALDEAIKIIRASDGKADAREKLMERFGLDWDQAEAILETKLYRLAKLEIDAIREELEAKRKAADEIRSILGSDERLWSLIRSELDALREAYGDKRRTRIVGPQEEQSFSEEVYITKEDAFVMVTRNGWFKRQKSYTDLSAVRVREGDEVGWVVPASTRETLVVFTDRGKAYSLRVADILATTGYGEPLQTRFDFSDGERVVGVITTDPRILPPPLEVTAEDEPTGDESVEEANGEVKSEPGAPETHGPFITAVTRGGKTARLSLELFQTPSTVNGRFFVRLDRKFPKDEVVLARISEPSELVSLATRNGRCLVFPVSEVKILSAAGKGVMAIKLSKGDYVMGATLVRDRMDGLQIETNRGRVETVRSNKFSVSRRGGKGREIIRMGHIASIQIPTYELGFPSGSGDEEDLELVPSEEVLVEQDAENTSDKGAPAQEDSGRSDTVPAMPVFDVPDEDDDQGDLF